MFNLGSDKFAEKLFYAQKNKKIHNIPKPKYSK